MQVWLSQVTTRRRATQRRSNVASGGFVVQRGTDAIVFGIIGPDEPEAKSQATAFANAVLTTLVP